jgi:hypothetical protein
MGGGGGVLGGEKYKFEDFLALMPDGLGGEGKSHSLMLSCLY